MKVLHIFNSLMPSGAETMWVAAAPLLADYGVQTHIIATSKNIGPYSDEMKRCGFSIYHIPHHSNHILDIIYCVKLYKFLVANKYDAVQVHPEAWRLTNVLVARLAGVRKITTTIHSIFTHKGIRWWRRVVGFRIIRALGAKVIAVGSSVKKNEEGFLYHPELIYNWIDVDRFKLLGQREKVRRELGVNEKMKVLMLVGNCSDIKNHAFMIGLMRLLPIEYRLVHIGREDETRYGERGLAIASGVSDRVVFMGARSDVPYLLEAADAFVMCSRLEGLGLSCLEALVKGVPAVVSDVPGLRDLAEHLPLCVISPLDEILFSKKIQEVTNWSVGEYELRRAKTKVSLANFDMRNGVEKYIELWR